MNIPQSVVIGSMNTKLESFDDTLQISKAGGLKKVQAIRVFYTDNYVRGFEIFYKLNAGDFLKASHNVPKKRKELQSAVFEIGPDDYLSEILGAYQSAKKNRIVNITFITYRGKALGFGGKGEQSFRFCYPGFTFGIFKGQFKKQIEWLEIQVQSLPEDFKIEMQKLGILKIQNIERTYSNTSNQSNNSIPYQPVIVVPKVQIAKPIINIPQQQQYPQYSNQFPQPSYPQYNQQQNTQQSQYPTFNQQQNQPQQPINPYR